MKQCSLQLGADRFSDRKGGHTITSIAKFFNLDRHTVRNAINGKAWA